MGDMDFLKKPDYIVPEAIFPPGLRILVPERAQRNIRVLKLQRGIPIFTDGFKFGGNRGAGGFCEYGLELHFRLNDDCRVL